MYVKTCENCKNGEQDPYEKPCDDCKPPELKGWEPAPPIGDPRKDCKTLERYEPKFIPDESPFPKVSAFSGKPVAPAVGIDPGSPEGDKTNVRLDWGERGPELIGPEDITSVEQLEDGHLVETARAAVKQITRLDYAIEGVRSKISSIGIKFTDKTLSRDELALLVCQLNALQADLFELEEEREAVRKAGQVPKL